MSSGRPRDRLLQLLLMWKQEEGWETEGSQDVFGLFWSQNQSAPIKSKLGVSVESLRRSEHEL